ncbi:type II toxin-antitoxin system HipA family toxinoxin YjjJ [Corticibacter populi]|uniref:Type II toxin-antitoxin system HipA family toxinoxin YjjJ n=1 Tax=Corticibacter populi TaxID=1550736 RepID=A0A3M6QYL3_9BURK|nr:type II toxin-antitoxin system HipA family toxin YjjJ [Corticibacter populi]RMX07983.1 type II toxin-antitoxin system HipA family toxinoxin YjjJ [Corticibacter populi]RZS35225.1 serine/threonine protein kinase HipA of HipAB toxin-antitoxin module [Corticibacter populi]
MSDHADVIRFCLAAGPVGASQLIEKARISQPTLSRTLRQMDSEIVRIGAARSIQYALRDARRGLPDMPVYRVDADGRLHLLGILVPVLPEGFVMQQDDGRTLHSDGLPWWLLDMRPQGYLGRAWVARHAGALGLPARIVDWSDAHALRALLAHGHDSVGNLVLGETARQSFLTQPLPTAIAQADKPAAYARLAREAAQGGLAGSSAGGEQPKFSTYAQTAQGPRHVLVKFSEGEGGPVTERWRDLLLAEHHALQTLAQAGVPAAASQLLDHGGQRFLEVDRFDRVGPLGRRGLLSLAALDAEFVGNAPAGWPGCVKALAAGGHIRAEAVQGAALLWAFGTLIGNTDMHTGNLSFLTEHGRPYALAPAYDMTPMAFAPRSGGGLPDALAPAQLHADVPNRTWRQAGELAQTFLARLERETGFSQRFAPCIAALQRHMALAAEQIGRLAVV